MIQYIVADDEKPTREAIHHFLQYKIETTFGAAQGTICGDVDEVLKELKAIGSNLCLIVLDMDFHGDILGGGLRILDELTPQQRCAVVVYSAKLDYKDTRSGRPLHDELNTVYELPSERVIAMIQGSAGLWTACSKVLSESSHST